VCAVPAQMDDGWLHTFVRTHPVCLCARVRVRACVRVCVCVRSHTTPMLPSTCQSLGLVDARLLRAYRDESKQHEEQLHHFEQQQHGPLPVCVRPLHATCTACVSVCKHERTRARARVTVCAQGCMRACAFMRLYARARVRAFCTCSARVSARARACKGGCICAHACTRGRPML
jgi:hypothetical protein